MNTIKKNSDLINVELLNLDDITKKTLSYFLASNMCTKAQLSKSNNDVNIYIVDACQDIDQNFLNYIDERSQFIIVLHMGDTSAIKKKENILFLKKPINTTKLLSLLSEAQESIKGNSIKAIIKERVETEKIVKVDPVDSMHDYIYSAVKSDNPNNIHKRFKAQKYVGSNKDVTHENLNDKRIFMTVKKYLCYYLKKARMLSKTDDSNILIKFSSNVIVYNFDNDEFLFYFENNKLRYFQTMQIIEEVKFLHVSKMEIENYSVYTRINADRFIWESAIQASKGRVPIGTDLLANIKMLTWPNFPKLQVLRYAVQISAVWSQQPLSLFDTAKHLKIPQRYVFTLYSAMRIMEYVKIDHRYNTNESIDKLEAKPQASVFSRIIAHLFN